ncbi:MAG: transcription-repair coupling factor [Pseudomonadales bacterium]
MSLITPLHPPLPQKPGQRLTWAGLHGASNSVAIASAAEHHDGLTVVICVDSSQSLQLEEELRFFASEPVVHLPDWETLPYDSFSPHQDIISERLRTFYRIGELQRGILVVPITALMQCTVAPHYIAQNSLVLANGQTLSIDSFRHKLTSSGYRHVETVFEHGEFAVRGAIIDVFPMGSKLPIRIELFDDEIDSLRSFDTESQRTSERLDRVNMLPAKEFPLDSGGVQTFRHNWHETFDVNHSACPIYQDISTGVASPGIEYYLPLFFDRRYTLLDHLPDEALIIHTSGVHAAAESFWQEIVNRYTEYGVDPLRPLLQPQQVFLRVDELFSELKQFTSVQQLEAGTASGEGNDLASTPLPAIDVNSQLAQPLQKLEHLLADSSARVLFCCESAGRRETMLEHLQNVGVQPVQLTHWSEFVAGDAQYNIAIAPVYVGCHMTADELLIICEDQLFGHRVRQRRRREPELGINADLVIKNLTELRIGAPVVHIEHGVGRYRGLITLTVDNSASEFLHLEYADDAQLYVPVTALHLINRYSGAEDDLAPLHRLGSDHWQKARRKAAEKVADVAAELLEIYAQRAARKGFKFNNPEADYRRFADMFPFEETVDQQTTIRAVMHDMLSDTAMDRLVCGDVGFGKTEIALRAAFVTAQNSKQVVVLVPTTLLAAQHFDTFKDRFADWPVTIEMLSRFKSAKEQQVIEKRLQEGSIDIVVGTHKLLQKKRRYKALGLLIIDEEHRFGVKQKEALKALRSEVDILTLTATPIPRTLNMSIAGLRDLSIIATPPARRLSVKTFVRERHDPVIREAILREILRGGQVYYLHNDVKTIERAAEELAELVPEARCVIGHGQMRERELERVMSDFYHKRFNVLVCTTIIETGLDVPTANTIIIERADKFGLAQLHQLRGRVGRSHHQAYAYLFTPSIKNISKDAVKRLEAIEQAGDLGAGFTLATHDMEIRGAGELLGEEQSGQIQNIGFSLYMDMLDRAVKALQSGEQLDLEQTFSMNSDINLRVPALIPDDYLPDVHNRLIMYKRIASAEDDATLLALREEMVDRFGVLTEPIKNLFRSAKLRREANALGIAKIDAGPAGGRIEFARNTSVEPFALVSLVQQQSATYKMQGANSLKFTMNLEAIEDRFQFIENLLVTLGTPVAA